MYDTAAVYPVLSCAMPHLFEGEECFQKELTVGESLTILGDYVLLLVFLPLTANALELN
jgi:hypothetical protein